MQDPKELKATYDGSVDPAKAIPGSGDPGVIPQDAPEPQPENPGSTPGA